MCMLLGANASSESEANDKGNYSFHSVGRKKKSKDQQFSSILAAKVTQLSI